MKDTTKAHPRELDNQNTTISVQLIEFIFKILMKSTKLYSVVNQANNRKKRLHNSLCTIPHNIRKGNTSQFILKGYHQSDN